MNGKLTLRMECGLIDDAKREARKRGKSVSQMVGEYFSSLAAKPPARKASTPLTASLIGVLKDSGMTEEVYKRHLLGKHL
jgi:hypothetical protein